MTTKLDQHCKICNQYKGMTWLETTIGYFAFNGNPRSNLFKPYFGKFERFKCTNCGHTETRNPNLK